MEADFTDPGRGPLALGIDFGTTYSSAAAVVDERVEYVLDGGERAIPSVVHYPPAGAPLVGRSALARAAADPTRTVSSIKRILGRGFDEPEVRRLDAGVGYRLERGPRGAPVVVLDDRQLAPPQVVAEVLGRLRELAELRFGRGTIERAVMSVPAGTGPGYREALTLAARLARMEVVRMVEEPVVGAFAVGKSMAPAERTIAVCDFGGGTFDITLALQRGHEFACPVVTGDPFLGGDDFDEALADGVAGQVHAAAAYDMRRDVVRWRGLVMRCEQVKRRLSAADRAALRMPDAFTAHGRQRDLELEITREAAEQRWQPLLARTREALQAALAAPAGGQTVDEVLLIGGTSLIPCVQRTVGQGFGRPIEIPEHADVVVTAGAAMLAHTLGAERLSPGR